MRGPQNPARMGPRAYLRARPATSAGRETGSGIDHQGEEGRMRSTEGPAMWVRLGTVAAAVLIAVTGCGSTTSTGGKVGSPPPTANIKPPTAIGPGEGQAKLIAWEGYTGKVRGGQFPAQTRGQGRGQERRSAGQQ